MAEALTWVRDARAWERWGHASLHDYARDEPKIRPATVDKLTGGYTTLREHAPEMLRGEACDVPSVDAVDYLASAMAETRGREAPRSRDDEVIEQIKHAVFEDAKPVAVLRREFDPILRPKPDGAEALEQMEKASAAARRLSALLPKLEDVTPATQTRCQRGIDALLDELDELIPEARDRLYPARAG